VTEFGATISRRSFLISIGLSGLQAPFGTLAQPAGRVARVGCISNVPGDSPLVGLERVAVLANPGQRVTRARTKEIAEVARARRIRSEVDLLSIREGHAAVLRGAGPS